MLFTTDAELYARSVERMRDAQREIREGRLADAEGEAQERLWSLEDEINVLQTATYNA